jgi:hypothetical protein
MNITFHALAATGIAHFPWHWPDGSGSMYPILSKAPDRTRILDTGQNTIVSWTNHLIVAAFAVAGIFMNPRVFRFFSPTDGTPSL